MQWLLTTEAGEPLLHILCVWHDLCPNTKDNLKNELQRALQPMVYKQLLEPLFNSHENHGNGVDNSTKAEQLFKIPSICLDMHAR